MRDLRQMGNIKDVLKRIPGVVSLYSFARNLPAKIENLTPIMFFKNAWWDFVFWAHLKLHKNGHMFLGGRVFGIASIYSFCKNADKAKVIKVIEASCMRMRDRLPKNRAEFISGTTEKINKPVVPIYVAEFENIYVVGDCDYLLQDDYYLNDLWEYNDINNKQDVCSSLRLKKYDNEKGLLTVDIENATELSCGIDLIKMWSSNYYHFTVESLSRLQYVDQLPEYKDYPLLIDEAVLASEHYKELIHLFNDKRREIICIKPNRAYYVKKLVYPSAHSWYYIAPFDGKMVRGDTVIDYKGIMNFKETIERKKDFLPKIKSGKKLFLTRGNDIRFLNDSEVGKYLKIHGFEIIDPGWMLLDEKIKMFSDVDVVIGSMGTQFLNLWYAPRGCRAYVICPYELQSRAFDEFFDAVGIIYRYLDCELVKLGATFNTSTFRISIDALEDLLEKMGIIKF